MLCETGSRAQGFRAEVDERDETLGKRIRDAELEKVPFVVVYGDRESEEALAVREQGGGQSTLRSRSSSSDFEGFPSRRRRQLPIRVPTARWRSLATIRALQAGADSFLTSRA